MLREPDEDGRYMLSGREYSALQMVLAATSCLEQTSELIPRIKKIPNGYRDYQMIRKRLLQLSEAILCTVPYKKLVAIREELKFMKVKTFYGGILGKQDHGMAFVQTDAMVDILNMIVGMECLLCTKTGKDVKRCPVRQVMNTLMPYELDPSADPKDGTCQMAGRTNIVDEED